MNDNSSSTITSDANDKLESDTSKSKKKRKMHWTKKPFVPPTSTFSGNFPTPQIDSELEPINYFYSMFGKESFDILKDQSNLHSVQVTPNRSVNISHTDIRQLIGILIMSGVHSFSQQHSYWMDGTAYTVKNFRILINGKTVYGTSINEKRVFEFATYNKPFLRVYYENNKRFFRF